ncbi:MAG: hypothetical protein Q4B77_00670 [Coriobacteriaceae bacterium]|nr:hypothetical protein [Coriobacteriaceae bacterium]
MKTLSRFVLVGLLTSMTFFSPAVALAGTANGPIASASSGPKDFGTYSRVQTTSTHANAYQFTRCTNA